MSGFEILSTWPVQPVVDDTDSEEDRATTGELQVRIRASELTGLIAQDTYRPGPRVPTYRLAEWFVWNWWRLRWEASPAGGRAARPLDWSHAHEMVHVGGPWLWPRMTIGSDGHRVTLRVSATRETATEPLAYVGRAGIVPAAAFEAGVDAFLSTVMRRLDSRSLYDTPLHTAHAELQRERGDRDASRYRRIEARLGFAVDEAPADVVLRVAADGEDMGHDAMDEVVADGTLEQKPAATDLRRMAHRSGHEANANDGVRLAGVAGSLTGQDAPWMIGVRAARKLREEELLRAEPVTDDRLSEMYGISPQCLKRRREAPMGFWLGPEDRGDSRSFGERLVLRSKTLTGRRFEVARLLADRLLVDSAEPLRPATRAATFRQKMQRAFAAEFLCPFDDLCDMLGGDHSEDAMERAARRYRVSPLLVRTHLANHGLVDMPDRDEIDTPSLHEALELEVAA